MTGRTFAASKTAKGKKGKKKKKSTESILFLKTRDQNSQT